MNFSQRFTIAVIVTATAAIGVSAAGAPPKTAARSHREPMAAREVRAAREAATRAINKRNFAAMKTYVDPSFQWKDSAGHTQGYGPIMAGIKQLLSLPTVHQDDVIQSVKVNGSTARLVIQRTDTFGRAGMKPVVQKFRAVEIWKKKGGRWRAVMESVPAGSG